MEYPSVMASALPFQMATETSPRSVARTVRMSREENESRRNVLVAGLIRPKESQTRGVNLEHGECSHSAGLYAFILTASLVMAAIAVRGASGTRGSSRSEKGDAKETSPHA